MGKRGAFNTNKLFGLVRKAALVAPAIAIAVGPATPENKLKLGIRQYTGFDINTGTWSWENLMKGLGPYAGAVVATYGIQKLGSLIRGIL